MTTGLQVRIAQSREELFRIFRLRYEVYVEQQQKPLPNADSTLRIVKDRLDEVATNFYVCDQDDQILACGRSTIGTWPEVCEGPFSIPQLEGFRREDFYYISKVMINPRFRSPLAIPSLFLEMYKDGRTKLCPFGIANCTPKLVPIYSRLGWRRFGPEFFDPHSGPQVPILLVAPGVDYLQKTRSILIQAAYDFPNDPFYLSWFERVFLGQEAVLTVCEEVAVQQLVPTNSRESSISGPQPKTILAGGPLNSPSEAGQEW